MNAIVQKPVIRRSQSQVMSVMTRLLNQFDGHFTTQQASQPAAKAQYEMLKHMPETWATIEEWRKLRREESL